MPTPDYEHLDNLQINQTRLVAAAEHLAAKLASFMSMLNDRDPPEGKDWPQCMLEDACAYGTILALEINECLSEVMDPPAVVEFYRNWADQLELDGAQPKDLDIPNWLKGGRENGDK